MLSAYFLSRADVPKYALEGELALKRISGQELGMFWTNHWKEDL
jgi:cytoplasmic iron level regulating protein YaaA (DUF328/UPF0246 family)